MTEPVYLILSDIHGSKSGAEVIHTASAYHQPDWILCLGDILYHGPRNDLPADYAPKEVIQVLSPWKDRIIAVRGNCDAEVDQMVLPFAITADYNILPWHSHKLFMSHGHVYGPDHLPSLAENDIFLSGHTHIPTATKKEGIYLLNPGSVSLPKGGHPRTYGLLKGNTFTVNTLNNEIYMAIDLTL